MMRITKAAITVAALGVVVGLSGCTSPFLTQIKEQVAIAPFTGSAYTFVRQWGNSDPEHAFDEPIVKTDSASNVYVADSSFRIRKYNTSGTLQSTVGGVSKLGPNAKMYDMAFDAAGNRYVTAENGLEFGTAMSGAPQVQKYDSNGKLLAEWATSTDLYNGLAISGARGIAVDSSGNIYVVDQGNNRIVKFNSSLSYVTDWGGATPYGGSGFALSNPTGIAVDSSSGTTYLYVTDAQNNRVVGFDSSGAYQNDWGGATAYGPKNLAMNYPQGIAIGTKNFTTHVYVADTSNNRIIEFSTSGAYSKEWGSSTVFNNANSVAVDPQGYVYVGDEGNGSFSFSGRVQKYDVSSTPTLVGSAWGGGSATAKGKLSAPWGIAFDSSGDLIVSEVANGRLQKFTPQGAWLATWTSASLSTPAGLTQDAAGNTYVADISGHHYEVFSPSGTDEGPVGASGTGNGTFGFVTGIAANSSGSLFVTDPGNVLIQKFGTDGFYKNLEWGGVGSGNGQFLESDLGGNYGIAVDPAGYVYVADYLADRIQKFDFNGKFISKFGSYGTGNGQFNAPVGMTVDKAGNLYVCDMLNHRVQKFDSNGNYLATIGGVGTGNGGFGWPVGVAVNSDGYVAVLDYVSGLLQVFAPTF